MTTKDKPLCIVPGCKKPLRSNRCCEAHAAKMRRKGWALEQLLEHEDKREPIVDPVGFHFRLGKSEGMALEARARERKLKAYSLLQKIVRDWMKGRLTP